MCRLSDLPSQATHLKQDGSHEQLCLRRSQITFHSYRMMITLAGTKMTRRGMDLLSRLLAVPAPTLILLLLFVRGILNNSIFQTAHIR